MNPPPTCQPPSRLRAGFSQSSPLMRRRAAGPLSDCVRLPPIKDLLPPYPDTIKRLAVAREALRESGKGILDKR